MTETGVCTRARVSFSVRYFVWPTKPSAVLYIRLVASSPFWPRRFDKAAHHVLLSSLIRAMSDLHASLAAIIATFSESQSAFGCQANRSASAAWNCVSWTRHSWSLQPANETKTRASKAGWIQVPRHPVFCCGLHGGLPRRHYKVLKSTAGCTKCSDVQWSFCCSPVP